MWAEIKTGVNPDSCVYVIRRIKYSYIYMSEFMKTVSNLGQNFRACLPAIAGREAFAVLEKPGGGASVKEGGER